MRSAPATVPGIEPRPFEFRVRFHAPVRRVRTVPLEAVSAATTRPAAEPKTTPKPEPKPQSRLEPQAQHAQPQPKAAPTLPPPQPPAPAPAPDFLPPDLEAELNADRERIETVLKKVSEVINSLREEHDLRLQQWQRAAVEMAMTTAARLLHERIVSGDFPIDAKVRDMVAQLGEDEPVAVRLNPLDLELLKSRMERASDEPLFTGPGTPRFIADSTLNRGECHVEGHDSMLLSDVTRELQDIREDLLRRIENARS
jgi:flagellar biosynthesis/type III secretory pathway protein FliH